MALFLHRIVHAQAGSLIRFGRNLQLIGSAVYLNLNTEKTAKMNRVPDTDHQMNWNDRGATLLSQGNCTAALQIYQDVINTDPDDVLANYNAGVACQTMGENALAIKYYQSAIQRHPNFVQAHHNLAQAYGDQHKYQLAEKSYQTALHIDPHDFNSAYNLALIYRKLDRVQSAITSCRSAIHIKPDWAEAFATLGMIYREQNQLQEACVCLEQALRIKPDLAMANYEMGIVCQKKGDYRTGLHHYKRAFEIDPDFAPAIWLYHLALPMLYENQNQIAYHRQRFQTHLTQLIDSVSLETDEQKQFALRGVGTTTNFFLQYQCKNDLALQKEYGQFVHKIMAANYPLWSNRKEMPEHPPGTPIRIGYVSTYMYEHTIGTFLSGWIKNHSKAKFEIYGYHVGRKKDATTKEIENQCHAFRHLPGDMLGNASQIVKDRLHLLVYSDIGMDPLTTQLAALRLAPIQCKGWGHPVTTGLPTMDYYLSSDLMEPHQAELHYSEQLVRLPNLALCYARPKLPTTLKNRNALGLPENRFIYLSSQSLFKYLPQHDDLYPRIAREVPHACFVFLNNQSDDATRRFRQRLATVFKAHGLDMAQFCYFSSRLNHSDFLSLNNASDVLLDSMEWSGGKTTLEALSCGLPVVTLPGRFMRGRHAYAMLRMLDIHETIAESKSAYCDLAVQLASDPTFLRHVQNKIIANQHNMYDDPIFMQALEQFYAMAVDSRLGPT